MTKYSVCSFFGHRKIIINEEIIVSIRENIENLIINYKVDTFLFGSKSEFNTLCLSIVTELKEKYPNINRIAYTCCGEGVILESERKYWEKIHSNIYKEKITLLGVEAECEHKTKWTSGKASYIERNYAMINDSYYCMFYYNEDYQPPKIGYCVPKSGTALALKYAIQKKKKIIRIGTNNK